MNLTIYLFGDFGEGYTQYPDDYTRDIFGRFAKGRGKGSCLATHRQGAIMYYGYMRSLDANHYAGMCCVINGYCFTDIPAMLDACEHVVESMAREGALLCYGDRGEVTSRVGRLYECKQEVAQASRWLWQALGDLDSKTAPLPPVSYGTSSDSEQHFALTDKPVAMVESSYTNGYTFVHKESGYDTPQMHGYRSVIMRKEKIIEELQAERNRLRSSVSALERKQRNTTWVGVLAVAVVVLGVVLWNKVLFPSEVTKKDMGEYVYYGPMQGGKPNGVGVAIYHQGDKDNRRFYYGNFTDGKRVDEHAMLFYNDGSYYYGSMDEDHWHNGLFYDTEKEHFEGEFVENRPFNGTWYKHVKAQEVHDGQ